MPRALITGITGQDGSYLAELLLADGYDVTGLVRDRDPLIPALRRLAPDAQLVTGDLQDQGSLVAALDAAQPDEVFSLAAFSEPGRSWQQAELCADVTGLGVLRLLEALRTWAGDDLRGVRFCQASSSEIFGRATGGRQDEQTPLRPRSPYGTAKAFAHNLTANYRDAYGLFGCCAILYNHESPRRGMDFVTRKISRGAAAISLGLTGELRLGNLASRRDWGHAADYVQAMTLMLRHVTADDYVVASGLTHSIEELLHMAFAVVGISDWTPYVVTDPDLFRPAEPDVLCGDASKARAVLGWTPTHSFEQLVAEMVRADLGELAGH